MPDDDPTDRPTAKILIVEDDSAIARALVRTVAGAGFAVVGPSALGREACELGLREQVQGALVDIQLADEVSGIEVARVLQCALGTHIVFTSAYDDIDVLQTASHCVRCTYLRKPFRPQQVLAALQVALLQQVTPPTLAAANGDQEPEPLRPDQMDIDHDLKWPLTQDAVCLASRVQEQALLDAAAQKFGLAEPLAWIAVAVAQGRSRAEISQQLKLSPASVEAHVKQVYRKTRQHGRRALALALCCEAVG